MSMIHLASSQSASFLNYALTTQDVQPNAVDLYLENVYAFDEKEGIPFSISELSKRHSAKVQLSADRAYDGFPAYRLAPGSYEVTFKGNITIGSVEAGFVITRSTFNRNGVFLTSGLYDSGYNGVMAGALHVGNPNGALIAKGTRIGQFLLFQAEALHTYDGSYGTAKDGTIKADDKRYYQSN